MNRATYNKLIPYGENWDNDLLNGARYALLAGLKTDKARWVIAEAMDRFGPENVYMDGELWSYR